MNYARFCLGGFARSVQTIWQHTHFILIATLLGCTPATAPQSDGGLPLGADANGVDGSNTPNTITPSDSSVDSAQTDSARADAIFASFDAGSIGASNGDAGSTTTAAFAGCGDGQRERLEICDDGNRNSGDGCDANCELEAGFRCEDTRDPAISAPVIQWTRNGDRFRGTFTLTALPQHPLSVNGPASAHENGQRSAFQLNGQVPAFVDVRYREFFAQIGSEQYFTMSFRPSQFVVGENIIEGPTQRSFATVALSRCTALGARTDFGIESPQISWGEVSNACATDQPIEFRWSSAPTTTDIQIQVVDTTTNAARDILFAATIPSTRRNFVFGTDALRGDFLLGCPTRGLRAIEVRVLAGMQAIGKFVFYSAPQARVLGSATRRPAATRHRAGQMLPGPIARSVDVAEAYQSMTLYRDMNGDNLADRVTQTEGGHLVVDPNTGAGFSAAPELWETVELADFVDMNGDGRPDMVSTPSLFKDPFGYADIFVIQQEVRVYLNDGRGFGPSVAFALPRALQNGITLDNLRGGLRWRAPISPTVGYPPPYSASDTQRAGRVKLLDLTGDGLPELFVRTGPNTLGVWFGTSSGWTPEPTTWSVPSGDSWEFVDMNGDGVLELWTRRSFDQMLSWGTGTGYQTTGTRISYPAAFDPSRGFSSSDDPNSPVTKSFRLMDIDGDGLLDLLDVGASLPDQGTGYNDLSTGGNFGVHGFAQGDLHYRVYRGTGGGFAQNWVRWSLPQNFFLNTRWQVVSGAAPNVPFEEACRDWMMADLDGSGAADFVCERHFQRTSTAWRVAAYDRQIKVFLAE